MESLCSLVVMDGEKDFVKDLFDTVSTELCLIYVATDDHASITKLGKKILPNDQNEGGGGKGFLNNNGKKLQY